MSYQEKQYIKKINAELIKYIDSDSEHYKQLIDSMKYSVEAGGKRIRPVLMMAVADMLGVSEEVVLPFACGLEMIHTASLIHDDLPCMDDDDLRRGKPTNHKVFGEALAVLAGDNLFIKPFQIVSEAISKVDTAEKAKCLAKAAEFLAECSVETGMIGGQVMDINAENCKIDMPTLIVLHQHKTGALFRAAMLIPCIIANTDDKVYELLKIYANALGLAFQVVDDILDVVGSEMKLGKPIGSDKENEKNTYVTLVGLEASRSMVKSLTNQAIAALNDLRDLGYDVSYLEETVSILANRES